MKIVSFLAAAALLFLTSFCTEEAYYSMEDFTSVRKVDTHTHPNTMHTAMAQQASADNFLIIAVNVDAPGYPSLDTQQEMAVSHKNAYPKNVVFLTSISMRGWGHEDWAASQASKMEEGFQAGSLGIKVWKNIGMVEKDSSGNFIMIDDSAFDPLVDLLVKHDKTLLAHLGEPRNCWLPIDSMTVNGDRNYFSRHPEYHMHLHPENPSYEELIEARDKFVGKHPDLRFVGAHLGSLEWSVDELAKRLDRFPNMAVDMAARISHFQYQSQKDPDRVRNFLIKYKDRLTYATDAVMFEDDDPQEAKKRLHDRWREDWKYFATDEVMTSPQLDGEFRGLKLPRDVIDHLYYKNAIKWFAIPNL